MKRLLIAMTIVAFSVVPQFALGSDLDDLKAADNKMGELYRSTDPTKTEAYINGFSEEFIWIHPAIAFPLVMTKEQLKGSKNRWISQNEYCDWIEVNSIYRVVGDTGFVFSIVMEQLKPKDSPVIITNSRASLTYIKVNGKWLLHTGHVSVIPSGN